MIAIVREDDRVADAAHSGSDIHFAKRASGMVMAWMHATPRSFRAQSMTPK